MICSRVWSIQFMVDYLAKPDRVRTYIHHGMNIMGDLKYRDAHLTISEEGRIDGLNPLN